MTQERGEINDETLSGFEPATQWSEVQYTTDPVL